MQRYDVMGVNLGFNDMLESWLESSVHKISTYGEKNPDAFHMFTLLTISMLEWLVANKKKVYRCWHETHKLVL